MSRTLTNELNFGSYSTESTSGFVSLAVHEGATGMPALADSFDGGGCRKASQLLLAALVGVGVLKAFPLIVAAQFLAGPAWLVEAAAVVAGVARA